MEKTYYILLFPDGNLVKIDYSSGGYPVSLGNTNFQHVTFWTNKKKAEEYQKMFPKLKLIKVTMIVEEIEDESNKS